MQYMLIVYNNPETQPKPGDDNFEEYIGGYMTCTQEFRDNDVMVSGDGLQGTETATTVRVTNGETQITDGPFAETKEILGGYYILDCKDLDEAIDCAKKIPGVAYGAIEIRPVMVYE